MLFFHSELGADSRRNPFSYHVPTPTNCSLVHSPHTSSPLTQCVWTFFWLAVLLFVAYPVGFLSGQVYVLLSALSALSCCEILNPVLTLLLQGLHMPLVATQNMAVAKPLVII